MRVLSKKKRVQKKIKYKEDNNENQWRQGSELGEKEGHINLRHSRQFTGHAH